MKLKQWKNIFHVIVNANSIAHHVIQIKNGIIKHVIVNVKIIMNVKKITVRILAHLFVRIANFKKYCWYLSDRVWWNYNCYGYFINKNGKYYSNKCYKYCFNTLSLEKSKRQLYFTYSFISNHVTTDNHYHLLLLSKKKGINVLTT